MGHAGQWREIEISFWRNLGYLLALNCLWGLLHIKWKSWSFCFNAQKSQPCVCPIILSADFFRIHHVQKAIKKNCTQFT
jgi:hypothetical protein